MANASDPIAALLDERTGNGGSSDVAVQGTSDDAAVSKLSSVQHGYFADDALKYFVASPTRRSPLINRGYFARVAALNNIIKDFLTYGDAEIESSKRPKKQIISLGAGFDTTYFRLKAQGLSADLYVEIDFAESMRRKALIVQKHKDLQAVINRGVAPAQPPSAGMDTGADNVSQSSHGSALGAGAPASATSPSTPSPFGTPKQNPKAKRIPLQGLMMSGPDYACIGCDLREVPNLEKLLAEAGVKFEPGYSTLFLSECVLVYMRPEESDAVIQWAATKCKQGGGGVFVTYEQILPNDPFGQTMMSNLSSRGCPLLGLPKYPDLDAQKARYQALGWTHTEAWDMNDIYRFYLPRDTVRRAERLELFDEFEEWHLIQGHYSISMAVIDAANAPNNVSGPFSVAASASSRSTSPLPSSSSPASSGADAASRPPLGLLGRSKTVAPGGAGSAPCPPSPFQSPPNFPRPITPGLSSNRSSFSQPPSPHLLSTPAATAQGHISPLGLLRPTTPELTAVDIERYPVPPSPRPPNSAEHGSLLSSNLHSHSGTAAQASANMQQSEH